MVIKMTDSKLILDIWPIGEFSTVAEQGKNSDEIGFVSRRRSFGVKIGITKTVKNIWCDVCGYYSEDCENFHNQQGVVAAILTVELSY